MDLTEQLCILSLCRGAPRVRGQDSPAKMGPQKVAPWLASPTTMVGHNIWSIVRGVRGWGGGSRESLNFGREKLDSMRGAQVHGLGSRRARLVFIKYDL